MRFNGISPAGRKGHEDNYKEMKRKTFATEDGYKHWGPASQEHQVRKFEDHDQRIQCAFGRPYLALSSLFGILHTLHRSH
jgi:hypothetical protein